MRRRQFIVGMAAAVTAMPARAQPPKTLLAILSNVPETTVRAGLWQAFWDGMRALGRAREDFSIETRSADGHPDRLPDLAGELVHLAPRIILTDGSEATVAAKQATTAIPIVFPVSSDPVGAGLVASIAHPGANVTGLSLASPDIAGKDVELLKTVAPQIRRVAVLSNPDDPTHARRAAAMVEAARSIALDGIVVDAVTPDQIDAAFAEMTRRQADAVIYLGTPRPADALAQIFGLALRNKFPSLADTATPGVTSRDLISYGAVVEDLFRRAATYVDKILKGAQPADLPVEQPTKFKLVINLKTAKTLGLTVPQLVLAQADDVIE